MRASASLSNKREAVVVEEVPKILDSTLRDIPARLRELAALVEAGKYGEVDTCAIVLAGERMVVLGYGDRSMHDTIGLTLLAGAHQCARNLE